MDLSAPRRETTRVSRLGIRIRTFGNVDNDQQELPCDRDSLCVPINAGVIRWLKHGHEKSITTEREDDRHYVTVRHM